MRIIKIIDYLVVMGEVWGFVFLISIFLDEEEV